MCKYPHIGVVEINVSYIEMLVKYSLVSAFLHIPAGIIVRSLGFMMLLS